MGVQFTVREPAEGEDTSFISFADFFSLLSIAFIYFAISFGTPAPSAPSLKVESTAEGGAGPAIPVDSSVANVSIFAETGGAVVRVISPSGEQIRDLNLRDVPNPLVTAPAWTYDQLIGLTNVKYVVIYMNAEDADAELFKLRDRIGRALSPHFDVRLVF